MGIQVGQFALEIALRPSPAARVGQFALEVALDNTTNTAPLRITQVAPEVLTASATSGDVRLTEVAPETLTRSSITGDVRITQIVVEVLHAFIGCDLVPPPTPGVRVAERRLIRRLRRGPHLAAEDVRLFYDLLVLQVESGMGLTTGQGSDPQIMLRWSDDGGHTWSDEVWTTIGTKGQYAWQALWRRLGSSRNRVFEVTVSDPVKWVLVDADLQVRAGNH